MLNINYDINGKVCRLTFSNNELHLNIQPFVFQIKKKNDDNIGFIIEKYRCELKKTNQIKANEYWASKNSVINSFIDNASYPFSSFSPEYITVFYPSDVNRSKLLERLFNSMKLDQTLDYSSSFSKINCSKSVVNDQEYYKNFNYSNPPKAKLLNKILIIDDTIDEGRTLDVFLSKLYDNNLLNSESEIKFICIYNNPKLDEKIKNINIREILNDDCY